MRLGLLLISLLPTSGMTISWTVLSKGNVNAAIKMVFIGLTLGALLSPFYITGMLGTAIKIPTSKIMTQILLVVFIPLIAAFITQKTIIRWKSKAVFDSKIKLIFPLFSTLSVVLIIFVAMALRAKVLLSNPLVVFEIGLPLIILYLSFIIISIATAKVMFEREDAIAFSNGTLVRNLSLSLAIILSTFTDASISALLIALAYVIQVQVAAWNTRLSPIIYKVKST